MVIFLSKFEHKIFLRKLVYSKKPNYFQLNLHSNKKISTIFLKILFLSYKLVSGVSKMILNNIPILKVKYFINILKEQVQNFQTCH